MAIEVVGKCSECDTRGNVSISSDGPTVCPECRSVDSIKELECLEINATRFGELQVFEDEWIEISLLGFEELRYYKLMSVTDSTNIRWLQSLEDPSVAFPLIELSIIGKGEGFGVLTIPNDMSKMTVNLKAPVVINGNKGIQEPVGNGDANHPVFHELRNKS